jgi:hypothetical protein
MVRVRWCWCRQQRQLSWVALCWQWCVAMGMLTRTLSGSQQVGRPSCKLRVLIGSIGFACCKWLGSVRQPWRVVRAAAERDMDMVVALFGQHACPRSFGSAGAVALALSMTAVLLPSGIILSVVPPRSPRSSGDQGLEACWAAAV